MSEWSQKMIRRISDKKEEDKIANERSRNNTKLKQAGLAAAWGEIYTNLIVMCKELRAENVGVDIVAETKGSEIHIIRKGTSAKIVGTFSDITFQMEFRGTRPNGHHWSEAFWIKTEDGDRWLIVDMHTRSHETEEIASQIIAALAGV
jgi:hypothetical protein